MELRKEGPGRTFEPMQYPSLAETVLVEMRRAIVNGRIRPEERLVETDLAAQFQVSRATIRQALAQLRFEGLVEMRPRRGSVVTRMASDDAREVCTVRGLLEGWAARTACRLLTADDLRMMEGIAVDMGESVKSGDVYRVMELDIALHTPICRADANQYLWERWQSLNALHGALLASRLAYYNYDPIGIVQRHRELIAALAGRDPDVAEEAVRHHYISPFLQGEQSESSAGTAGTASLRTVGEGLD